MDALMLEVKYFSRKLAAIQKFAIPHADLQFDSNMGADLVKEITMARRDD